MICSCGLCVDVISVCAPSLNGLHELWNRSTQFLSEIGNESRAEMRYPQFTSSLEGVTSDNEGR